MLIVGDGVLAKKIRMYTCLAIAFIIVCATAAIVVVSEKDIDVVKNIEITGNTSDSIEVNWNEVKGAEGYHIYLLNSDSGEYEKFTDVTGGQNCTYVFKEMEGGTVCKVKVTAFKFFNNKEYESEEAQEVTVFSLPDVPDIMVSSPEEGMLSVNWTAQTNALGYELQYSKNEDFSDAQDEVLSENSFQVENLTPKDIYYVRARAFIEVNNKNVYGLWCDPSKIEIKKKVVMNPDIDPKKPIVALSFDDGPGFDEDGVNSTQEILKVLEEYGARATFFMCGSRINKSNAQLLKKEIELGCELGNHTYSHKNYGKKVTEEDIKKCSDTIKKVSGQYPTIFRCPGGIMTKKIQEECKKEGMPIAYWSVEPEDWKTRDANKIYKSVMKNVYDGSIILLHDIYPSTAEAVKKIVPKLIEEGYQIVGVSEMITVKNGGNPPEAGQQYIDYNTINNNT